MTEKRFTLSKDTEWWTVKDNTIQVNEFGYREDLTGEDKYRGLQQDLTEQETVDLLNELAEDNQDLQKKEVELGQNYLRLLVENGELKQNCKNYGWYKEYKRLLNENEQLKEVLGSILIEVRRDISATNHSVEVKAFVTPNSFDLIVDVLKKYGALKDWYE